MTTVEKAVDVLFHLHAQPAAAGVTSIGKELGLAKSSTHRLLVALRKRGLVEQDESGRYRPGIGLVALGLGALDREPVVAAARPVLEAEADVLGETVFLVSARASRLVVLDKAEGTGFLRASPRIGSEVPVHATAVGKLYLAFGDGSIALSAGSLEAFTPETSTDRSVLEPEVSRAARRGVAENRDEWIPGLSVVAAAVLTDGGRMVGALAAAAPSPRMDALGRDEVAERMLAAAARVAGRLEGVDR